MRPLLKDEDSAQQRRKETALLGVSGQIPGRSALGCGAYLRIANSLSIRKYDPYYGILRARITAPVVSGPSAQQYPPDNTEWKQGNVAISAPGAEIEWSCECRQVPSFRITESGEETLTLHCQWLYLRAAQRLHGRSTESRQFPVQCFRGVQVACSRARSIPFSRDTAIVSGAMLFLHGRLRRSSP